MLGDYLGEWLQIGLLAHISDDFHHSILVVVTFLAVIGFLALSFYISRHLLRPVINKAIDRMDGDTLEATKVERPVVVSHIAHLVPAILLILLVNFFFGTWPSVEAVAAKLTWLYLYVFIGLAIAGLVDLLSAIFALKYESSNIPYRVISQLAKLLIFIVVVILSISLVIGSSPSYLLSGLGALTAVLMLVFKDAILGFVASIQLVANQMVSKGDWIEMQRYGADGSVVEVALTTVKVRNWDNTITTIPTYALISESFKNWRAMQESGGRRIKRSILLDIKTIHFLDTEEIEELKSHKALHNFFAEQSYIDLNKEGLTNTALFRAYVEWVLRKNININQRLTLMVRLMQPTEVGLPVEVYCFSADKNWVNYERIQSDIFDNLFAILPEFKLAAFQRLGGRSEEGEA